jgi:hypothetical protein
MRKVAERGHASALSSSQLLSALDDCDDMHKGELFASKAHLDCADKPEWIFNLNKLVSRPDVPERVYDKFCPAKK